MISISDKELASANVTRIQARQYVRDNGHLL